MTPIGAEGLQLPAILQALVSEDPPRLAASICRLHADEAAHRDAVTAGLALIRDNHNEAAVRSALQAAIEGRAPPASAVA